MSKNKLELLIEAAEDAGLEAYGEYSGRNYFKGYAIKIDHLSDLLSLGAAMERCGCGDLAKGDVHVDSLGRGYVVAFSDRVLGRK